MIRETLLVGVVWLAVTVGGLPVDPFLPAAVSLALVRRWPVELKLAGLVALALVAAALCGQPQGEMLARYGLVGGLAWLWAPTMRGTPRSRMLLSGTGLLLVQVGQVLAHAAGTANAPGDGWQALVGTVCWVGLHGWMVRWRR